MNQPIKVIIESSRNRFLLLFNYKLCNETHPYSIDPQHNNAAIRICTESKVELDFRCRRDRDSVQLSIADFAWGRATHRVVCRAVPIRQSSCSDVAGFLRCREIYSFHSLTCRWGKN